VHRAIPRFFLLIISIFVIWLVIMSVEAADLCIWSGESKIATI